MNHASFDRSLPAVPVETLAVLPGVPDGGWAAALQALCAQSGASLCVKELASGRIVYADSRHLALFAPGTAVVGALESSLVGEGQVEAFRNAEQAAVAAVAPIPAPHWIESNGQRRDFLVSRVPVAASDGSVRHLAALWVETTAELQRERRLQQALEQIERLQASAEAARREAHALALHDAVTGLYQRPQFDDLLRREVDLSSREHREFALAAVEVDPFGDDVRALGEPAQQRVLEAVGRLLRGNTRAMDASCRVEGRRFAVLLSGVGLATAHARMESMRRQCATQIVVQDGHNLGFTVSMGVASFPHTAHTQAELVAASEAALAEAQRRGGNHVTLASIRFDAR